MPTESGLVRQAAREVIASLEDGKKLLFLCGAGISTGAPACAPAWLVFRDGLIKALIERLRASRYLSNIAARRVHFSLLHVEQRSGLIVKPEVVLHWLHSGLKSAIFNSFRVLSSGTPNYNHRALAALAKHGVIDVLATTNFDLYLERALDTHAVAHETFASLEATGATLPWNAFDIKRCKKGFIGVLKIHGSLDAPTTLQATLRQVSRALPVPLRRNLSSLLEGRHLLVLGYSGNDYDLFPFLMQESRRMLSVTWCARETTRLRPEVRTLHSNMRMVVCNAESLLSDICSELKIRVNTSHSGARANGVPGYEHDLSSWASDIDPLHAAHTLAMLARHLGDTETAAKMSHVVQLGATEYIARSWNMLGVLARRTNSQRSLHLYKMALATAKPLRQFAPILFSNILGNIGALEHDEDNHSAALRWLRQSVVWAKKGRSFRHVYQNLDDIGNCLRGLGRLGDAIKCHTLAIRYHRRTGNLIGVAHALSNKGEALRKSGRTREAWKAFTQSLALKERETAEAESIIRSLSNVFDMSLELGLDETLDTGRRLLALLKEVADPLIEARTHLGMAQLYARLNEKRLGKSSFERAQKLIEGIPFWGCDKERCALVENARAALGLASSGKS